VNDILVSIRMNSRKSLQDTSHAGMTVYNVYVINIIIFNVLRITHLFVWVMFQKLMVEKCLKCYYN